MRLRLCLWRKLSSDEDLAQFFKYDKCCRIADNYLIAMVFIYFIRADFEVEEYTPLNFLAALHLALDMEEDDDNLHSQLQRWLNANDATSYILDERNRVFQRIGYRGSISRKCCESIIRRINPNHSVWRRLRHTNHSGAISVYSRKRNMCPRCLQTDFFLESPTMDSKLSTRNS
ncbi:speedy protein A-like isoform X2 [Belonocnema kinseyi]|uniref:speedy protein A-like isoform X2 n=1 Tax=Belonocnema kinseyi TaxID=2817044 RepID=UPI00143D853C|nr:speedy protein A-like isoform X2 [Belonocnema kinseyi]